MLKGTIDTGKTNYHSDFANALEDKENTIARLRKELANKDNKLREIEEELSRLDEVARRQKRDLSEMERIREELNSALVQLQERDRAVERLRSGESGYEEEL
jgi:DNA repair ATPase RecN